MVNLVEFVLALHSKLLEAIQMGDQEAIARLLTTFGVLVDASYAYNDKSVTELLVSFEDSARSAAMSVDWTAPVPSVETVEAALKKA